MVAPARMSDGHSAYSAHDAETAGPRERPVRAAPP